MADWQLRTPVALIIFNRPDTTEKVFEAIRRAKPPKLLVVADGPRADKPDDAAKCAATRAIIERVDWDCEVLKNYSDINIGCGRRPATGITWVFENVEEAIIFEDDCLPHPDFFRFCDEMLEKYRDDKRVMAVGGTNVLGEWKSNIQSYHFSYHGSVWGWASWRRAWQYFDYDIKMWENPEVRTRIRDVMADDEQYKKREEIFESVYQKQRPTVWDYQWYFARMSQSGLTVIPSVNLVVNKGFGHKDATHTKSNNLGFPDIDKSPFKFPIKFNEFTVVDRDFEKALFKKIMPSRNLIVRIKNKVARLTDQLTTVRD
ncbi:glycosyltransferase family 2 protein [Microcoleus sp. FACHB-831]|uniref:glycosyltransferase family 2 protein n=1 Tax=Microcoleus sp. FACHB-831 TaxID=2692827 RepID=UPI001685E6D9|nr:glycosyltransferase family 2 protein [Microcoleus sp. FACHB-831]MBD1922873.1 glycosyltransferase family 2 protein [Microcoleus sp. FACHB-831]